MKEKNVRRGRDKNSLLCKLCNLTEHKLGRSVTEQCFMRYSFSELTVMRKNDKEKGMLQNVAGS